jgi:hypothetical protein
MAAPPAGATVAGHGSRCATDRRRMGRRPAAGSDEDGDMAMKIELEYCVQ